MPQRLSLTFTFLPTNISRLRYLQSAKTMTSKISRKQAVPNEPVRLEDRKKTKLEEEDVLQYLLGGGEPVIVERYIQGNVFGETSARVGSTFIQLPIIAWDCDPVQGSHPVISDEQAKHKDVGSASGSQETKRITAVPRDWPPTFRPDWV